MTFKYHILSGWILLSAAGTFADDYADVLQRHVDERGRVDYAALKQQRAPLDRYVRSLNEQEE